MSYCIFTRAFNETPYLSFFIEHYVKLGFDKIIILKCDMFKFTIPEKYKSNVIIHQVKNLGNKLLSTYSHLIIKKNYEWILIIDVDEILLLNKKFKNIKHYVRSKMKMNKNINVFYFRWCMINKYDVEKNNDFNYIINNYYLNVNRTIKSMVKGDSLKIVNHPHMVQTNRKMVIYFENSIMYENLPKHNVKDTSYQESILIHLHTRSIHNLIIKSLTNNVNMSKGKRIEDKQKFINFVNNGDNVVEDFKNIIGTKAKLPFKNSLQDKYKLEGKYRIYKYGNDVINLQEERKILNFYLKKDNIDKNKYNLLIRKINNVCKNHFID